MSMTFDVECVLLPAATAFVKGDGALLVSADQPGVPARALPPTSTRCTTAPAPPVDAGFTVIVTSSLVESVPSVAVRRRTYVPAIEKLAVVPSTLALPNVTVPGPLNLDHVVVRVLPAGNPSSLAVPARVALPGRVIV
jgi:hypothetical protein